MDVHVNEISGGSSQWKIRSLATLIAANEQIGTPKEVTRMTRGLVVFAGDKKEPRRAEVRDSFRADSSRVREEDC
jgi:hypothetical protein